MFYKKLSKFLIGTLLVFFVQNSFAQKETVINNKGTRIDVVNNVVTTGAQPTNPQIDDIWFDTSTTPNTIKIWDGTAWKNLVSPDNWLLTGNTGTNSTTNFIGTTDAQDLVFKAGNAEKLRINNAVGQLLVNQAPVFGTHPLVIRANGVNVLAFQDNTGAPKWHWNLLSDGLNFSESSVADYRLFLKSGGNIGINTDAPTERLDVNGNTRIRANLSVTGTYNDSSGDAGIAGQVLSSTATGTNWVDPNLVTVENKTANYTLTAADNGKVFTFNSTTQVTLTVPNGLPVGFNISTYQTGAGRVLVQGVAGVTILNRLSRFKTAGKDAGAGLVSTSTNTFHLTGDLRK